jgi:hypothetical protein
MDGNTAPKHGSQMSQERLEMLMRQFTEPGMRSILNELAIAAAINMPFETYSALPMPCGDAH